MDGIDGWKSACPVAAMNAGEMRRIEGDHPPILLCRVGEEFFAAGDNCTHQDYALSEGYLDGDVIECPLHMAQYSARTGEALALPASTPLETYDTKVVDGVVHVKLPGGAAKEGIA